MWRASKAGIEGGHRRRASIEGGHRRRASKARDRKDAEDRVHVSNSSIALMNQVLQGSKLLLCIHREAC